MDLLRLLCHFHTAFHWRYTLIPQFKIEKNVPFRQLICVNLNFIESLPQRKIHPGMARNVSGIWRIAGLFLSVHPHPDSAAGIDLKWIASLFLHTHSRLRMNVNVLGCVKKCG